MSNHPGDFVCRAKPECRKLFPDPEQRENHEWLEHRFKFDGGPAIAPRMAQEMVQRIATEHTPTPWEYRDGDDNGFYQVGAQENIGIYSPVEREFILCAVNSHDSLLAALKTAKETIRLWHNMGSGLTEQQISQMWALYQNSPEMKQINAAIAEAEKLQSSARPPAENPTNIGGRV